MNVCSCCDNCWTWTAVCQDPRITAIHNWCWISKLTCGFLCFKWNVLTLDKCKLILELFPQKPIISKQHVILWDLQSELGLQPSSPTCHCTVISVCVQFFMIFSAIFYELRISPFLPILWNPTQKDGMFTGSTVEIKPIKTSHKTREIPTFPYKSVSH